MAAEREDEGTHESVYQEDAEAMEILMEDEELEIMVAHAFLDTQAVVRRLQQTYRAGHIDLDSRRREEQDFREVVMTGMVFYES